MDFRQTPLKENQAADGFVGGVPSKSIADTFDLRKLEEFTEDVVLVASSQVRWPLRYCYRIAVDRCGGIESQYRSEIGHHTDGLQRNPFSGGAIRQVQNRTNLRGIGR